MPKKVNNKTPDIRFLKNHLTPDSFAFVANFVLIWPAFALLPDSLYRFIPDDVKYGDKPVSIVIIQNAINEYNLNVKDESGFSGVDYLNHFIRAFISAFKAIGLIIVEERGKSSLIIDYASKRAPKEKPGKIIGYRFEPLPEDSHDYLKRFYEVVVPQPIQLALRRSNKNPLDQLLQGESYGVEAI